MQTNGTSKSNAVAVTAGGSTKASNKSSNTKAISTGASRFQGAGVRRGNHAQDGDMNFIAGVAGNAATLGAACETGANA